MSNKTGGTDIKQKSTLDPAQQKLLRETSAVLSQGLKDGATALPFDSFAEAPDLFTQAFESFAQSFEEGGTQDFVRSQLENIAQGLSGFEADTQGVVSDFQTQILSPVTRTLRETLGVDIQNLANQPGRLFASDVPTQVAEGISQQIGLTTAPLLAQSLEAERNRAFQSQQLATQQQLPAIAALQGLDITQTQQAFGVATAEQAQRQAGLSSRANEFLRLAPENNPYLKLALGFSTASTMENIGITNPDWVGSAIGGASGALVAASDRRVKENIVEIATPLEKVSALTGYTYNYRPNPSTDRTGGVMAQDLEAILPAAVTEIDGIKHVRYDAVIGLLVNAVNELNTKVKVL